MVASTFVLFSVTMRSSFWNRPGFLPSPFMLLPKAPSAPSSLWPRLPSSVMIALMSGVTFVRISEPGVSGGAPAEPRSMPT